MRGQTVLELLAVATVLALTSTAIVLLIWLSFINFRMNDIIHEALICRTSASLEISKSQLRIFCEKNMSSDIKAIVGSPDILSIQWHRSADSIGLEVTLTIGSTKGPHPLWKNLKLRFQKQLELPLRLTS